MTGVPIYLVSACTTGEEFISAFRRYADRNGVIFIPIADPLPAGRKGRFALALSTGGVMVEGQAEVVSSARTPSVLYGRTGMTVKFLAPDEPSQTILAELEKARTSLKPPAPSIPARPAEIPTEPRPKPPTPGGRIDAINALAECVVIGDVSTLSRDSDLSTVAPPVTPGAVTVKPIATMPPPFKAAAKPVAPIAPERSKPASIPPAVPPLPASIGKATTLGLPALDRKPATPPTPAGGSPVAALNATTLGLPAIGRTPAATTPAPNAPPPPKPLFAAPPPPIEAPPPSRDEAVAAALRFAKAVEARGGSIDETIRTPPSGLAGLTETIRGTAPPRVAQTPATEEEKTDLTQIPSEPADSSRRTSIGVAVPPPADLETRATVQMSALDDGLVPVEQVDPLASTQTAIRLSKLHPTVEEPSGDWTMSTNDGQMTITPRKKDEDEAAEPEPPKLPPKGPPTGDWMIALDPSRPDGWSEPSKVEKRPPGELPGPPVSAVASDKPLDSNARAQPELASDEPKIQIDPTLIEPLTPMPVEPGDDDDVAEPPAAMPPPPSASTLLPLAAPPPSQQMLAQPGAVPILASSTTPGMGALPMTSPRAPMPMTPDAFATPPVGIANAQGSSPAIGVEPTMTGAPPKRTMMFALIGVAVVIGVVLGILLLRGDKEKKADPPKAPTSTAPSPAPAPAPAPAVAPPPPKPVAPPPQEPEAAIEIEESTKPVEPVAPATPTECALTIQSVPAAAAVTIDGEDKGNAPVTVTVPCGKPLAVSVKKQRYVTTQRDITPKPNAKPTKIVLQRTTFTVKVSSTPPGATVTLNGKTLGMTPTLVKVPAFETSMLKITKDGYAAETQKVAPKNNATSVSVALKKTAKATTKKK